MIEILTHIFRFVALGAIFGLGLLGLLWPFLGAL